MSTCNLALCQCGDNKEDTMSSSEIPAKKFVKNHLIHTKYREVLIVNVRIKNVPLFAKDSILAILNVGFTCLELHG